VQPAGVLVDAGARDGEQLGDLVGGQQRLVELDVDGDRLGEAG
jgi:hypothetical protein